MSTGSGGVVERATELPTAKFVFAGLVALLLAIAIGHLYAIGGLTTLSLGLPLWAWLQLGVVAIMLGIAWVAVRVVTAASGGA